MNWFEGKNLTVTQLPLYLTFNREYIYKFWIVQRRELKRNIANLGLKYWSIFANKAYNE